MSDMSEISGTFLVGDDTKDLQFGKARIERKDGFFLLQITIGSYIFETIKRPALLTWGRRPRLTWDLLYCFKGPIDERTLNSAIAELKRNQRIDAKAKQK